MRRAKRPSLRGSVQQTTTVRVRPREQGRFTLLVRLSILGGVLFLLICAGLWSWESGWLHRQMQAVNESVLHVTQKAHFAVSDIMVEGWEQSSKDQLFAALEAPRGSPLFAFKPAEAAARIAKLPWVESVTVERRLPSTIFVRVTEHVPLARWQHDNRVAIIDAKGKILPEADPQQFTHLPLVVGTGAPAEAHTLLETLHSFPLVESKTLAAVRVGERRWDLHLPSSVVVRLPEGDMLDALKRLTVLITEQKILERDIVAIDLRIPDRLVIESGASSTTQQPGKGEGRL